MIKLKLFYVICLDNTYIGVHKKIKSQINAFERSGINVDLINVIKKNDTLFEKILRRITFSNYNASWDRILDSNSKGVYYFRYFAFDKQFYNTLKRIKKMNKQNIIILEIPTYPFYNEKRNNNYLTRFIELKNKFYQNKIHKYIDRVVTYSQDEEIFNIDTIKISNGVDLEKVKVKSPTMCENNINLIAVATFDFWHGYDRLIEGLREYYNGFPEQIVNIHFVGDGEELVKYKILTSKYNLDNFIKFHGRLTGDQLDAIYDCCDIAIDSLGRHRTGIYYNSTLKGKEYGAKGLPIVSGVMTELDFDKKYKYYMRVLSDDSHINISSVIDFYKNVYQENITKKEVISSIRKYTEEHFSIDKSIIPIIKYIKVKENIN